MEHEDRWKCEKCGSTDIQEQEFDTLLDDVGDEMHPRTPYKCETCGYEGILLLE